MACTVNDLLKLTVLSEAKVVAGAKGLSRVIKSISFIEAPDSINWVMPHDLLLTNAFLLNANPDMKKDFIKNLSVKQVAAVGIKLDRYIKSLTEEMITQANETSFPIIILPYNVTPSQLISAISKVIYSNETSPNKDINNVQAKLMYNFFSELFYDKNLSKTTLLRKASSLGWDFTKSFCVMMFEVNKLTYARKIISIVNSTSCEKTCFIFQYRREIIAIREVDTCNEKKELEKFCQKIIIKCMAEMPDLSISIGIGRSYNNLFDLNKSHSEARIALRLGNLSFKNNSVHLFDDLGIYKVLCQVDRPEELEDYTKETVTKLQRYDQENNTEYYKTMEAFIKYNGNVNETAKHLCVHYNTVKYRLNTIKKILGINIEDPDKRLDFQIGMKIANLLKLKV